MKNRVGTTDPEGVRPAGPGPRPLPAPSTERERRCGAPPFALPCRKQGERMAGVEGQVRLGIVGLGGMGSNHLRNAGTIPGVRVTAVCDTDPSKTAAAGEQGAA